MSGIRPVLSAEVHGHLSHSSSLSQPLQSIDAMARPPATSQVLSPSPHLTGSWLRQALPPSVFSAPACFTSDSAFVSEAICVPQEGLGDRKGLRRGALKSLETATLAHNWLICVISCFATYSLSETKMPSANTEIKNFNKS